MMDKAELLVWLNGQFKAACHALTARLQSAETWQTGSTASWKLVGCRMTKAERLRESDKERRIAGKYRRDLDAIEALLAIVNAQQP